MRRRPEARLERDVLLEFGADPTLALYRNEVGQGYYGCIRSLLCDPVRGVLAGSPLLKPVQHVLYRNRVTYGLGVGSTDLVGIQAPIGRFLGFELKAGSETSPEQLTWHEAARSRGALIEVVRSVDEMRKVLTG